jgi:hypothetical protein
VSVCLLASITPKRISFFVIFTGDGTIDEEEFKSLCVSYGLNPQDSLEAYNKFTSVCTNNLINKYTHIHICMHVHTYIFTY